MKQLAFIQNIGMPEMVAIFIVALLIFGPKSLPKLGRALGRGMREFREASSKVTETFQSLGEEEERPAPRKQHEPEPEVEPEKSEKPREESGAEEEKPEPARSEKT